MSATHAVREEPQGALAGIEDTSVRWWFVNGISIQTPSPANHTILPLCFCRCVKKRSDPPKFVVTKLCLLCAVMEHLQIQKVKVVPVIGCCAGVLVSEQYYLTVQ